MSVAKVTTREGSPTRVINSALTQPPAAPISKTSGIAQSALTPLFTSQPNAQAASPIIEPTERSISALMMTKVMASATITFSIESWKRLIWLARVMNCGVSKLLMPTTSSRTDKSRPSQLRKRDRTAEVAFMRSLLCFGKRDFRKRLFCCVGSHPAGH